MPMGKVSEQNEGIRTLNQGRPRLCLSLTQFKRGDTCFEPGGTGTPAPPCLKIGKYRFSSAFPVARPHEAQKGAQKGSENPLKGRLRRLPEALLIIVDLRSRFLWPP